MQEQQSCFRLQAFGTAKTCKKLSSVIILTIVIIVVVRNKMNPHNLAICFAPVLMLDTSDYLDLQTEPSIVQQLQILKYLIEIWPKSQETL